MRKHYILKGHEVVTTDLTEWATWFEKSDRIVAQDTVDDVRVSTVFLGLDHQFGDGPPLLFETMVFAEPDNFIECHCERYSTWEEAETGHARAMKWVENGMSENME